MKKPSIHRWSYSLWSQFMKCPRSVKHAKIDKIPQPPVQAMERGTMYHLKAEYFLKGKITGMPKELSKLADQYKALRKAGPEHIEEFWSLGRNWKRVKDGFRDGWFTLKADAALSPRKFGVAIGIDHKTGRYYPNHDEQAELTGLMLRKWYPKDSDGYEVEFFYMDQGTVESYRFAAKFLDRRMEHWQEQGELIMAERKFLATPSSDACKWCAFRSDKLTDDGKRGPCDAWKSLRDSGGARR